MQPHGKAFQFCGLSLVDDNKLKRHAWKKSNAVGDLSNGKT